MDGHIVAELIDITKAFPGVMALNKVSMKIKAGSVHALLGENGAGKSTLMKILSGVYRDYDGQILFDGNPVKFKSEKDALELGIAMVPQELNSIPELTIAEYVYLGRESAGKFGFVNKKERLKTTRDYMDHLGLEYDVNVKMCHLSVAQKQMIEIIKAISRNARLIIMDEPTSALTNSETEYLFCQIQSLKEKGIGIIFISHKLDEVYKICDTVTILRDGQLIDNKELSEIHEGTLISMMVGREVKDIYPKLKPCKDRVVLEVANLTGEGFSNINFQVREGEILGLAGMMGAGRTEIVRSLFGMDKVHGGEVKIDGCKVKITSVQSAINKGIAMVSEDRAAFGFVGLLSIEDNIVLPNSDRFFAKLFRQKKLIDKDINKICEKMKVKAPDNNTRVGTLSGGNQQKVVLAKWLIRHIKVLILDEPTRGIDVGAKQEIYKLIVDLAESGIAIILISSEMPEVLAMSHRIKALADGKFAGEFFHGQVTQDMVMKSIIERREIDGTKD